MRSNLQAPVTGRIFIRGRSVRLTKNQIYTGAIEFEGAVAIAMESKSLETLRMETVRTQTLNSIHNIYLISVILIQFTTGTSMELTTSTLPHTSFKYQLSTNSFLILAISSRTIKVDRSIERDRFQNQVQKFGILSFLTVIL